MRVFVTGGTGFVGSAVVYELLAAGHEVVGLARSDVAAAAIAAAGAIPLAGALEDVDVLRSGAEHADAVIHTAFDNSALVKFPRNSKTERAGLHAIGEALVGSDRPLVAAGGFAPVMRSGPVFLETDAASTSTGPVGRNVERTIMGLADAGVNASVIRMPCVHGEGDRFTLPRFIELARKHQESGYLGDGANRLPAVHVTDAARLFRIAIEHATPGTRLHAVGEEGVAFRDIALAIGNGLHVPAVSMSGLRARRHFGLFAAYAETDGPASSALTRARFGWEPSGPPLLNDLDGRAYFPETGPANALDRHTRARPDT